MLLSTIGLGLLCAPSASVPAPSSAAIAAMQERGHTTDAQPVAKDESEVLIDPTLPRYEAVRGVSGSINCIGSDTMNNLLHLWNQGFVETYPNVITEGEGKGSGSAPPALIEGSATFGPMSRPMKTEEIHSFKEEFGYEPTGLATSIDMLAVYVHKDNPLRGLTLEQVDAIFSQNRLGGYKEEILTWGQLGLTNEEWKDKPISIYGRNSTSGTYGYFKNNALFKGDFKSSVNEQTGSAAVVGGVAGDKYAIGYSGIGYKTADVRAVPLKRADEPEFVAAEAANAYAGTYALARPLLLYVNYNPKKPLDPLRAEYLKYIFSFEGQSSVPKDGYLPIGGLVAKREMAKVGIEITLVKPDAIEASAPVSGAKR